jgi:hypothetical protein
MRLPFALLNRVLNPMVRGLLRSPAHRLLSGRLLVITVTGRRTGRTHSFPVIYRQEAEAIRIVVGGAQWKQWWRNLRGGAPVSLRLRGDERDGWAEVHGDERTRVEVSVALKNGT